MGSQTRKYSPLEDAELLIHSQRASALDAEASPRYSPALPSPSPSPGNHCLTSASARETSADDTYSRESLGKILPTPRSSRRTTWNCQAPAEDKGSTSNHASSSTSPCGPSLTTYTSPRPSREDSLPISLAQQNERITEDEEFGSKALIDLRREDSAVGILERMLKVKSKSLDDSTDEEEGATTTTTTRDILCHGNTYLSLVPHAGCARWELTGQTDPASVDSQHNNRLSTSRLEDHNGELDCPRCSPFERSRAKSFAKSRNKRESTVPLTEDAEDCIADRRNGAAEYDDAYHDFHSFKLSKHQLKRRERYIAFHAGTTGG